MLVIRPALARERTLRRMVIAEQQSTAPESVGLNRSRLRRIDESVQEVHSLELEMAAELGIIGLLAFGFLLAGVGLAGRDALRARAQLAAGPCAASVVWLLHASIDWDWQLPAVSLPVIVLAGALIALSEYRLGS